ncbi:MAG: hypothetical protein GTN80_04505 [Nitrososphaeria archaeon]|nr:hypothetical protein [Nitrososphaeria archaeon]NIT03955.1 hypothetical protein [Candidatus Saccharibacteria bacterium]
MKRVILSFLTIVVALATVAGATYSVFSDQESITGNTFATGTVILTLNESAGKPFSVSNAYPGYTTGWEYMDIYNQLGSLPFEAQISFSKTGGNDLLWNKLWITLKTSGWDSDCTNGDAGEGVIYNGYIKNYPSSRVVSNIAYWHLANEDDGSGPPDNIRVGYAERVCQKLMLHPSAGNDVMGTSVTFDEVVDAKSDND